MTMESQAWKVSEVVAEEVRRLRESIESVFLGKSECVELVLVALLARGHVLLEDVPGVGKTTLSNALTGRRDPTQGIRQDDAKGRHTTTARALWRTRPGGWLVV